MHSLSVGDTTSSSLHDPAPISETAITLTMYSTPASSPVRIVEFAGGEPETLTFITFKTFTSYSVTGKSLWGVVQDTFRVKLLSSTDVVTDTFMTLEGTDRQMIE